MAGLAPVGLWLCPQDGPAAPKIGIVDLHRLFKNDALIEADIAAIKAKGKDYEAAIAKMREEYNVLKLECDSMADRASEKYVRTFAAMLAKEQEIKGFKNGIEAYLEQEGLRFNLNAYKRYRAAITELASKRKLDFVLRINDPDDQERSLGARWQAAELGMVLYHEPKLDITDDVIAFLKTAK
jgi:Skp family chaperone for outer membrane proteins